MERPVDPVGDDDRRALIRAVESSFDTLITWDYTQAERPALDAL